MRLTAILLLLIFAIACSENNNSNDASESEASASGVSESIDSLEAVVIRENAAVFLLPDSNGLNKLKAGLSEEKFYKIAQDNHYYFSQAVELLKEKGVRPIFPEKRYLLFEKKDGNMVSIDRETLNDGWWIVLFNSKKEPMRFSPVEIYTIIDFIKGKV